MESTTKGDSIKGDRIVVEFGICNKFNIIAGSSTHRRRSATFDDNVCCTIVNPLRKKIHKITE